MFSKISDSKKKEEHEDLVRELYRQIGQLKVELDRLKKVWNGRLRTNAG